MAKKKLMKTFKYNGMTFTPLRQFAVFENFKYLSKRLNSSLGVHNYSKEVRSDKVCDWNHTEFYAEAKKAGAGETDIFLLNDRVEVIPCENELFIYKTD
jgi:hypothetical protein